MYPHAQGAGSLGLFGDHVVRAEAQGISLPGPQPLEVGHLPHLGKVMKAICFPSGERCGNQLLYSSSVTCSGSVPSAFIRQICIVPLRVELK